MQAERAHKDAAEREEAADQAEVDTDSHAEAAEAADNRLQNDGPVDSLDAPGETITFWLGALNVQGWARKQKEVEATRAQFDLDALSRSETKGREPGWLEADGYRILKAVCKAWR